MLTAGRGYQKLIEILFNLLQTLWSCTLKCTRRRADSMRKYENHFSSVGNRCCWRRVDNCIISDARLIIWFWFLSITWRARTSFLDFYPWPFVVFSFLQFFVFLSFFIGLSVIMCNALAFRHDFYKVLQTTIVSYYMLTRSVEYMAQTYFRSVEVN